MTLILPFFIKTARREAMKRIEKTLLHNPDLCPFGLVAQGEKIEEALLISFLASLHDFCYNNVSISIETRVNEKEQIFA